MIRTKAVKHDPSKSFANKEEVALALFFCLEQNDPEAFLEILDAYLVVNHRKPRPSQRPFFQKSNPTIRTIAQIVHEAVA